MKEYLVGIFYEADKECFEYYSLIEFAGHSEYSCICTFTAAYKFLSHWISMDEKYSPPSRWVLRFFVHSDRRCYLSSSILDADGSSGFARSLDRDDISDECGLQK